MQSDDPNTNNNASAAIDCGECKNFAQIREMERRLNIGEGRFHKIEREIFETRSELRENNTTTNTINELLKRVHDGLFVDSSDRKSIQSTNLLLSQRVAHLWAIVIFIVVSISGIAFALIEKSIDKPSNTQQSPVFALPQRDDRLPGDLRTPKKVK